MSASLEAMTDEQRNSAALQRLFSHPEFGIEAKRLYKKVVPDARFPDVEAADRADADKAATQKEIDALRERVQMNEIQGRRDAEHKKIRDAGLEPVEVEKVMTEEKISSYDTAIKYVLGQRKNSAPSPSSVTPIRMPDNLADIQKDPRKWASETAHKAMDEVIAARKA